MNNISGSSTEISHGTCICISEEILEGKELTEESKSICFAPYINNERGLSTDGKISTGVNEILDIIINREKNSVETILYPNKNTPVEIILGLGKVPAKFEKTNP